MKYGNETLGRVEAILNKITAQAGEGGIDLLLSDQLIITRRKQSREERDGIIYFEVISDGTTGPEWIKRHEKKDFRLSKRAKDVLNSPKFVATSGVTYTVGVLKGKLFLDSERISHNIRIKAVNSKMILPETEIGCLIRDMFSDEDIKAMGLWAIVTMHDPIEVSDGGPVLLTASRGYDSWWFDAYYDRPGYRWNREYGFAFVVPQVS